MGKIALDRELEAFDFSQIHPVREGLLDQLLMMQRSRNYGGNLRNRLQATRLAEEELDWVAAARGIEQDPDRDR